MAGTVKDPEYIEPDWQVARSFRLPVAVAGGTEPFTPFAVEIDFGRVLRDLQGDGCFARHSVVVTRCGPDGEETHVPHALSEAFSYDRGDCGEVSWVVEAPDHLRYFVYFDVEENGPFPPPTQIALVGNGDALRYNSGVGEPLDVGIAVQMPVFVDWTGDGTLDLMLGSTYANTLGQPYNGTWLFRNLGSRERPLYDDFLRLRVDGEFIGTQVFDAVDWNGDGLVDLVAKPYGKNEIHVYLNTGERDRQGLPVLRRGDVIDLAQVMGPGGQCGLGSMQLVDLHGDGCSHVAGVVRELADRSEFGHIFGPYYDNYVVIFENERSAGQVPRFKAPYHLCLPDGSSLTMKGSSGGWVGDWDGDGVWDVLLVEVEEGGSKRHLRLFHNEGTNARPHLVDAGLLAEGRYTAGGGRYYDNVAYRGFIIREGDRMFRYLEDVRTRPGPPILRDRGRLLQRGGRVSVGEYSWPCLCDWDGDGGRDLVIGNADGTPFLVEEVGTSDPPVFRPPRALETEGTVIRHTWGNSLGQTGGERTEGYWGPAMVDWDGDGLDDLLAPVGISHGKVVDGELVPEGRLFFYRNIGTRNQPRYAAPREMLLADGTRPVATHTVSPVDWDGDGGWDLVGFDQTGRLCVFRLRDDPRLDPLTLMPGEPLRMGDGRDFCYDVIYELVGRPWGCQAVVCDWDGRGVWDVIVGTREMLILFRNVGTRSEPVYGPGERLALWGEPIRHSVHNLRPWPVDWDGTGRVDLVVGAESGWVHLFRRPALEGPRPVGRVGSPEVRGADAHGPS